MWRKQGRADAERKWTCSRVDKQQARHVEQIVDWKGKESNGVQVIGRFCSLGTGGSLSHQ
jgi:hypothetical protein